MESRTPAAGVTRGYREITQGARGCIAHQRPSSSNSNSSSNSSSSSSNSSTLQTTGVAGIREEPLATPMMAALQCQVPVATPTLALAEALGRFQTTIMSSNRREVAGNNTTLAATTSVGGTEDRWKVPGSGSGSSGTAAAFQTAMLSSSWEASRRVMVRATTRKSRSSMEVP